VTEVILYRGVVEHIDNTLISSAQMFKICFPNRPEMPFDYLCLSSYACVFILLKFYCKYYAIYL